MSSNNVQLSTLIYNQLITPISFRIHKSIPRSKCFDHLPEDREAVLILKNVGFKFSYLSLVFFAPIEFVVRTALSFVAHTFSIVSFPIEWIFKLPISLIFYKKLPSNFFSNKIYNLAVDLQSQNHNIMTACHFGIYTLLYSRNNPLKYYD
jgi:hypothetical protein